MGIKKVLQFEKENMPDFQWKFEKFLFAFLFVWLGGAILSLILSMLINLFAKNGKLYYLIPVFVWAGAVFGMLIALVVMSKTVKRKLVRYHSDNLSREFYETDYAEAKQKMLEDEKITENGFIVTVDDIDEIERENIPFEQVEIFFNPVFWGGKLFLGTVLNDKRDRQFFEELTNSYYNFLTHHVDLIQNKCLFNLFVSHSGLEPASRNVGYRAVLPRSIASTYRKYADATQPCQSHTIYTLSVRSSFDG